MKRIKGLFLFLILLFSFSFLNFSPVFSQNSSSLTVEIEDNTFYNFFCSEERWFWLCRGESFALPAVKNNDNWFYFSQGFFDGQDSSQKLTFTFNSFVLGSSGEDLWLRLNLKSVTASTGIIKLRFDWGDGWKDLSFQQNEDWFILSEEKQEKTINLSLLFPSLGLTENDSPWRLEIRALPLVSSQSMMLAIDQAIIEARPNLQEPTPTKPPISPIPTVLPLPSPTPTPSPSVQKNLPRGEFLLPDNKVKVYFNESVDLAFKAWDDKGLSRIIIQFSSDEKTWRNLLDQDLSLKNYYWSHRWFPTEEGSFLLRARVYNQDEELVIIDSPSRFVFDQTPPELFWQSPVDGDSLVEPLELQITTEDSLGKPTERVRFFYRYRSNSWQEIKETPWYFPNDLPLGDYRLLAQVTDLAGNIGKKEISLKRNLKIFNIFLVDGVLSWQTNYPSFSRVVYDRQSRTLEPNSLGDDFLNLGYAWASDQLSKDKVMTHQYRLPALPSGKYFGRILAFGSPVVYSQEFSFTTDNLFASKNEDGGGLTLGETGKALEDLSQNEETERTTEEKEAGFALNWPRVLVIFILAFLVGGVLVFYQIRK